MIPPRPFSGRSLSVAHVEELRRFAESTAMIPSDYEGLERGPRGAFLDRRRIRPRSGGIDLSIFTFGLMSAISTPAEHVDATIKAGLVIFTETGSITPVAQATLKIETSPGFAILKINKGNGACEWIAAGSLPADTVGLVHRIYYEFRAGRLYSVHRLGNLEV